MTIKPESASVAAAHTAAEQLGRDALAATIERWAADSAVFPICGIFDYSREVLQLSKIEPSAVPHIVPSLVLERCVDEGADAAALVVPVFEDAGDGGPPRVVVFCCLAGQVRQILTATHRVTAEAPGEFVVDQEPESAQWGEPRRRLLH